MTRPIGPMERMALDAAAKVEAARVALLALREAMPSGSADSRELMLRWTDETMRSVAVNDITFAWARAQDDAAKTWLVWVWDRHARGWYDVSDYTVSYAVKRARGARQASAWVVHGPSALRGRGFDSSDEGKRACEDHLRQRGEFAPKETP